MDETIFLGGKRPTFDDVFRAAAKNSATTLIRYDFYPCLDDSGDEMETAISQLHELWNMFFLNDGNVDEDYDKWWDDYIRVASSGSLAGMYCDDIRGQFIRHDVYEKWMA